MACFSPLHGWRSIKPNPSGNFPVVFEKGDNLQEVEVACGQCLGCRLAKARDWSIRCVHEAQMWDSSSFITLTYDNEHLPHGGTLVKHHHQDFIKRLRIDLDRNHNGQKIRFFLCGEYGDKLARPHYHALIFGWDFPDKELLFQRDGYQISTSRQLETLWHFGLSSVGNLTVETAEYVSRYALKKITGSEADEHYWRYDARFHDLVQVEPEYIAMSRRPGIGAAWFEDFQTDIYPEDHLVHQGREYRPPKFYDKRFELSDPETFRALRARRLAKAKARSHDNTPDRLRVRQTVAERRLQQRNRTYEETLQ